MSFLTLFFGSIGGVLDPNTLFEKKIYKISLEIKLMLKIVRHVTVMNNDN